MKKGVIFLLLLLVLNLKFVSAWGHETHTRFCPEDSIDCNIADSFEFQRNNPYANSIYHVCYDNKKDCMPRLVAKYLLKKYHIEGKINQELLGATAHLFQDASCPGHWYPGFRTLGQDRYPFAPKWVKTLEQDVNAVLSRQEENWNVAINYRGEIINVNENYLNEIKKSVSESISQEPEQSLDEIESQIKSKKVWHYLRAYQNHIIILFILFVPVFGFGLWKYKKEKRISSNLIVSSIILIILACLFILIKNFY